ncbi:MAG: redoxin domain-containing protein [Candidatus Doudnabacteria bacterium]|nr:redoxin domain-containing protein [Candidatus Doudnabacteria bacterium]
MTTAEKNRWRRIRSNRVSPSFQLQSATTGKLISLEEFNYKRLVLAFIPGVWAPWCRRFLDQLDIPQEVARGDIEVKFVAIISQDYEQLYSYVRSQKLAVEVLSDPNGVIGKRYGVFDDNLTEPMRISKPSIFILDSKKNVVHSFIGLHLMDRPSVSEILEKANEPLESDSNSRNFWSFIFRKPAYAIN